MALDPCLLVLPIVDYFASAINCPYNSCLEKCSEWQPRICRKIPLVNRGGISRDEASKLRYCDARCPVDIMYVFLAFVNGEREKSSFEKIGIFGSHKILDRSALQANLI